MNVFKKRKMTPGHVTQKLQLAADDPRRIAPNIALQPKSSLEELLAGHKSRFTDS